MDLRALQSVPAGVLWVDGIGLTFGTDWKRQKSLARPVARNQCRRESRREWNCERYEASQGACYGSSDSGWGDLQIRSVGSGARGL